MGSMEGKGRKCGTDLIPWFLCLFLFLTCLPFFSHSQTERKLGKGRGKGGREEKERRKGWRMEGKGGTREGGRII